jgi:hypothetical protein
MPVKISSNIRIKGYNRITTDAITRPIPESKNPPNMKQLYNREPANHYYPLLSFKSLLSPPVLKLRPAMKSMTELIFSRGGYLRDRKKLEKESSTVPTMCIETRDPKGLSKTCQHPAIGAESS